MSTCIAAITTSASGVTETDLLKRPEINDLHAKMDIVHRIEGANKAVNWQEAENAISPAMVFMRINEKDCYVVRYSDKEIQDAIVELYIKINERKLEDPWFEPGESAEFMDELRTMAESTFSPKIYEMELYPGKFMATGRLKVEYLAAVNSTQTLDAFLRSGTWNKNADVLMDNIGRDMDINIIEATQILAAMGKSEPKLLMREKQKIIDHIMGILRFYEKRPQMLQRDYDARSAALDVLACFADADDAPMARQIADESLAAKKGDKDLAEKLKAKATSIFSSRPDDLLHRPLLTDPKRIHELSQRIKDAWKLENWQPAYDAVNKAIGYMEMPDGKNAYCVRYGNKEIHEAIIDFYLKLYEKSSNEEWAEKWFSPGEGGEWFYDIATYAESTFSDRIYELELFPKNVPNFAGPGTLRMEYLARVNTSQTLATLLNSYIKSDGHEVYGLKYGPNHKSLNFEVRDAFALVTRMSETCPQLLQQNRDQIRIWVSRYASYYDFNPYYWPGDYDAREKALQILAFFRDTRDIPLIRKIADDAQKPVPGRRIYENVHPAKLKAQAQGILKSCFGIQDSTTETAKSAK
jgi:hypothetical protein